MSRRIHHLREKLRNMGVDRQLGFLSIIAGILLEIPDISYLKSAGWIAMLIGVILCY